MTRISYLLLGLLLLTGCLYSNTLKAGFIFDDALFLSNENVTEPGGWAHFLRLTSLRPLTYFTFYLNWLWGGADPVPFHVVNLALHLLNTLLVFFCLRAFWLGSNEDPAAASFAALAGSTLFALHPLQTEAVNYVYQRSSLLACFFGLLGLWVLQRRRNAASFAAAFLCYVAVLLSKETALVWPLVYLLFFVPPDRLGGRAGKWLGSAFLVTLAAGAWAIWKVEKSGEGTLAWQSFYGPAVYLRTECRVILEYFTLLLLPIGQNIDHHVQVAPAWSGSALWPVAVAGAFVVAAAVLAWKGSRAGLGLLISLLFLLPTSSILPSNDLMFEHRMYLPLFGVAMVAAACFEFLRQRSWPRNPQRAWVFPAVLSIYLAPWTWARNAVWSDPIVLWSDAAAKSPQKARPLVMLGTLQVEKDPRAAAATLEKSLALEPRNREGLNNLALAHVRLGDGQKAERLWSELLSADPAYLTAHKNLAAFLYRQGRYREAAEHFAKVLEQRPQDWQAYFNLANAHWRLHEWPQAEDLYRRALSLKPDASHALNNLGALLQTQGKQEEAEVLVRKAIAVDRAYLDARLNLAQILMAQAKDAEARQELDAAKDLDRDGIYRQRIEALQAKLHR